jgi:hypothetical protein
MEKHSSAHNAPVPQFGIWRISQTRHDRRDQAQGYILLHMAKCLVVQPILC